MFTLISRRIWHAWIARKRVAGNLAFRTLIVGTNEEAVHLAERLSGRTFGFDPVGMVATRDGAGDPELPIVGVSATSASSSSRRAPSASSLPRALSPWRS